VTPHPDGSLSKQAPEGGRPPRFEAGGTTRTHCTVSFTRALAALERVGRGDPVACPDAVTLGSVGNITIWCRPR
jgi:hypothetical protein